MIITLSGEPGSGKSTIARELATKFSLKHYSTGDLMRQIAVERGKTLEEIGRDAEEGFAIDQCLDERQKQLGENEDHFIIDGRLSAVFIPSAFKVFLTADLVERATRIFNAGRDMEAFESLEDTRKSILSREASERKRYLKWYRIDPADPKIYNLVYDTTGKGVNRVIEDLCREINQSLVDKDMN